MIIASLTLAVTARAAGEPDFNTPDLIPAPYWVSYPDMNKAC
ncbi:MAG: hypothetical protein ABFS56_34355 [Pseudomonadota bacterium]